MTDTTMSAAAAKHAEARRRNIAAILPLLPNQKALLLYQDLEASEDPGFLQVRFTLDGPLDVELFKRAWDVVQTWHPALRMSIHARPGGDPMAVAWHKAALCWYEEDWTGQTDQQARMSALLHDDRRKGLDLSEPPAMRVTLVKLSERQHRVIWTCHHIFSDGWSAAIVLEDVMANYRALVRPEITRPTSPPPVDGLRSYVDWVTQPIDTVEGYWRERLAGFSGLPRLSIGDLEDDAAEPGTHTVSLDHALVEAMVAAGTDLHVTANAFVQAAWSVVLSRLFGTHDVVFGTTVAGRSAPIEGMERLVGYFSNAVPIRVALDNAATVAEWLRALRDEQFALLGNEHASLADVHAWSDVPGHHPLFESFLVFENFPNQPGDGADGLVMSEFRSGLTAAFPLTIAVTLGEQWEIHGRFDPSRCGRDAGRRITEALAATLEAMVGDLNQTVGDLLASAGDALPNLHQGPRLPQAADADGYRAPATSSEQRLAALWERVLGLARVGVDDDYFDLGGTSLGAVRLFQQIEQEFGVALPLNTLLQQPTISGLATLLEPDARRPSPSEAQPSLVPIQTGGTRTPIICIHGGGGEILVYRNLAKHLGPDQPVYGLEPLGLDGRTTPLDSIAAMASRYVEELRAVQPHGPYRLVGYCFGGSVGLEMAAQLEAVGERVDRLVVVDGGLPLEAARASTTLERAWAVLKTRGVLGALRAGIRRYSNRGKVWWDGSFGGAAGRERAKYRPVAEACDRAFATFEPRPSSAPVTLIRSSRDHFGLGRDWHTGWDAYTPRFDTVIVDADHFSLFDEPHVDEVAAAILSHPPHSG